MDKLCTGCNAYHNVKEFGPRKSSKDGINSWCRNYINSYNKVWRNHNQDKTRDSWLRQTYGVTLNWYKVQAEYQGGRCDICKKSQDEVTMHVDHDHKTGKVRALLCRNCNHLLGNALDDKDILYSAIAYLDYHNG